MIIILNSFYLENWLSSCQHVFVHLSLPFFIHIIFNLVSMVNLFQSHWRWCQGHAKVKVKIGQIDFLFHYTTSVTHDNQKGARSLKVTQGHAKVKYI